MFNKRGISPLIATVLIIGFTIALAALIITWGVSFVTQQTVETGEEAQKTLDLVKNSGIKIRKVTFDDNDDGTNNGPDMFDVQIENTGTITLDGFLIRAYDTNGDVYTNDYEILNGLGAFGVKTFSGLNLYLDDPTTPVGDLSNAKSGDLIPRFRGELTQFKKQDWRATP
ncbi:MAG: archaellin/type IV pilin N-terminal domain-containing protein [Nanoarchaeota archaeon]